MTSPRVLKILPVLALVALGACVQAAGVPTTVGTEAVPGGAAQPAN